MVEIIPQGGAKVQLLLIVCFQKQREMSSPQCIWQPICIVSIMLLLLFVEPSGSQRETTLVATTKLNLLQRFPGRAKHFLINCQSVTRNFKLVQHQQVFKWSNLKAVQGLVFLWLIRTETLCVLQYWDLSQSHQVYSLVSTYKHKMKTSDSMKV